MYLTETQPDLRWIKPPKPQHTIRSKCYIQKTICIGAWLVPFVSLFVWPRNLFWKLCFFLHKNMDCLCIHGTRLKVAQHRSWWFKAWSNHVWQEISGVASVQSLALQGKKLSHVHKNLTMLKRTVNFTQKKVITFQYF